MGTSRAVGAILRTDGLRLVRDQFLLGASAYVAGCAIALRWVVPWAEAELLRENNFDLAPYVPMGVAYFVVVNASVITGMLGGFLLLESREERTLEAMRVAPTPLGVHLGTLGSVVFLAGVAITIVLSALVGVGVPDWGAVAISALLGAPSGVIMALMLATIASNKVEAFAAMKLISLLGLLTVAAFFVPEPLQYVFGLVPPYWACKIWWLASDGDPSWPHLVAPGVIVSSLWIRWLVPRFLAAARR
jgi:fluoroquinolone transport system permease protein